MSPSVDTLGAVVAGGLSLLVMFPLIWRLVAVLSGWHALAARFPALAGEGDRELDISSAQVGFAAFNGVLVVSAGPSGLALSVWFPPWGFSPIRIPWAAISGWELHKDWVGRRRLRLSVDGRRLALLGDGVDDLTRIRDEPRVVLSGACSMPSKTLQVAKNAGQGTMIR